MAFKKKIFAFGLIAVFLFTAFEGSPKSAQAAAANWNNKGVTIAPRWNTDFCSSSFQQSIKNAVAIHVNNFALIYPLSQSNVSTTDLRTHPNAPTDDCLISAINFIHGQGAKATIKIHVYPDDGQWSANINPSDRNGWFGNYGKFLNHVGSIAQSTHAEQIVIGSELLSMSECKVPISLDTFSAVF